MNTVFVNTIVFVKDIEKSKIFYSDLVGRKIVQDYGTIVFFENHLVLHAADSILKTIFKKRKYSGLGKQGKRNVLLYFETNKLGDVYNRIAKSVKLIHGIEKQAWGQKVFRFYDLDRHMIEIGEPFRVEELK
jgi:catechol 2,3-dioxygenase-like lactoylglutathione lyase family enzyme